MIRAFLAFLEARGGGEVLAGELREALARDGDEGRAALVAAGVIRQGSLATTHPCDGLECAREVRERERAKDGRRRFLAVCTRSPRECETVHLAEGELAQDRVVVSAFLDAVREALRIDAPLGGAESGRGASGGRALTGADEPVLLGEQVIDGEARDVFFAQRPGAPAVRALLAERGAMARGALILAPTARGMASDVLARYGAGHVEIALLSDLLVVQRGEIAAAARLRVVPPRARVPASVPANEAKAETPKRRTAAPRSARTALERLPRAKRWGEVTFYTVENEHSIGVEIDRRTCVFTASELGMAVGRTSEPVRAFVLLRRICEGNGLFDTRPWGGRENGKQIVSELRRGLAALFEIPESPIESYSRGAKSWKTRFIASAAKPSELRAAERALFGGERSESEERKKRAKSKRRGD